MIDGIIPRNRGLPGDVVAVKLLPKSQWKVRILFKKNKKLQCIQNFWP